MVGAIILIAVGLIFLLQNLGWLSWDVWGAIGQIWPLILIAVGLDFLLGRNNRYRGPILLGTAALAVVLVLFYALRPASPGGVEQVSEALQGARQARVELSPSVTRLEVGALPAGSPNLVEGQLGLLRGERLERDTGRDGDALRVSYRTQGNTRGLTGNRGSSWQVNLSPDVPLDLRVNAGVGETRLNLRLLRVEQLDLDSGVGRVYVELPERGQLEADVSGGVGEIEVVVPAGVALRVKADRGLGALDLPDGLVRRGEDRYESPDYEGAANRVDLEINGGIGRIQVRR
ncbi:LiaI-LiaF-like domain-containing protein [Calidithermus chliarophilus]|uniref:LiaI-LiaF-like domain-containing protein n=1 Tax=Calidithermus chliarophilus TaxID=52023 RepID=UPI00040475C5|nr:DUF5668 domain-containing protein [Calidithermus chliarophilus]